jgi:hypothetical protein
MDIIPTWMHMEGPEGFKQSVMALVHPTIPQKTPLNACSISKRLLEAAKNGHPEGVDGSEFLLLI